MAKVLNTSGINYYLEELIKGASDRLYLVSPYLQVNRRLRGILEDKNRLKIDVRVVYGKSKLSEPEADWLASLHYIRTTFCKNLHAKCYLNEDLAIVCSMNLYEFSQINNNEMGILLSRSEEPGLFTDLNTEIQRLIRSSAESHIVGRPTHRGTEDTVRSGDAPAIPDSEIVTELEEKLSSSKLARRYKISTDAMIDKLALGGLLEKQGDRFLLTEKAKAAGAEYVARSRFGPYFLWPVETVVSMLDVS